MKLLLDTHAALWWVADDPQLSARAATMLGEDEHEVLLSAVVVWEMAIKRRLGKLQAPEDLDAVLLRGGACALPISIAHAKRVASLPDHHRDPFDRLLVAQALIEGAALVTRDDALAAYDIETVWD